MITFLNLRFVFGFPRPKSTVAERKCGQTRQANPLVEQVAGVTFTRGDLRLNIAESGKPPTRKPAEL
jgi:hypothetical protein